MTTPAAFCANCGSPLTNGVCPTCPPPAYQPQPALGTTSPFAPGAPYAVYQQPGPAFPANAPGVQYIGQWNWGAFLLCPFWLMNHRQVGMGVLYLILNFIPFLNIGTLIMAIYYGAKGNEVAVASGRFTDDAQFVAVLNAWRNWGIGILIVSLALAFVFGVIAAVIAIVSSAR